MKPQPKSFRASATACVVPKSGGSNPGIPPTRQTPGLPSPSARDASTCRSGRALGSPRIESNTTFPTSLPLLPDTTSITSWNPDPTGRCSTGVPSEVVSTGDTRVPSGAAKPRNTMRGPLRGVGLGVGVSGGSNERNNSIKSAMLISPSPLTSAQGHVSVGTLPNMHATSAVRSSGPTRSSQLTPRVTAATRVGLRAKTRATAPTTRAETRKISLMPNRRAKNRATMPIGCRTVNIYRRGPPRDLLPPKVHVAAPCQPDSLIVEAPESGGSQWPRKSGPSQKPKPARSCHVCRGT